jgi:hypothetical protein
MVDPRPHDIAKPHGWLVQKVLWLVRRRYDGPVLIRGGRIGGQRRMLFDGNRSKVSQLRFSGSTQPSEVLVAAPGCYGWQIDGRGFSRMLVFRAVCVQPDKRVFRSCPTSNRSRR